MDPKHLPAAVLVALGLSREGIAQAEEPPERLIYEVGVDICLSPIEFDDPPPRPTHVLGPEVALEPRTPCLSLILDAPPTPLDNTGFMGMFLRQEFAREIDVREVAALGRWVSAEPPVAPSLPPHRAKDGPLDEDEEEGLRRGQRRRLEERQRLMQERYLPDAAPRRRLLGVLVADGRLPEDVVDALDEELG